ncbi:hypothetical protein GCM10020331_089250 [Ectobacillus funiculus]
MAMAKAYMADINDFQVGETYELLEEPNVHFTITYFNGVFAWGVSRGKAGGRGRYSYFFIKETREAVSSLVSNA